MCVCGVSVCVGEKEKEREAEGEKVGLFKKISIRRVNHKIAFIIRRKKSKSKFKFQIQFQEFQSSVQSFYFNWNQHAQPKYFNSTLDYCFNTINNNGNLKRK